MDKKEVRPLKNGKSKAIKSLKSGMEASAEIPANAHLNGFKRLCEAYIGTGDEKKREQAIKKIIRQENGLIDMLRQNDSLLTSNLEMAMMELALGCTVTETHIKTGSNGRTVERVERQLPPNQNAAEFLLINRSPDRFTKNPEAVKADGEGRIAEIMEALKNVK